VQVILLQLLQINRGIRGAQSNDWDVSSPVKTYPFLSIERALSDDHLNAGTYASLRCAFTHFYIFPRSGGENYKKRRWGLTPRPKKAGDVAILYRERAHPILERRCGDKNMFSR
jgi:hypothetical protein